MCTVLRITSASTIPAKVVASWLQWGRVTDGGEARCGEWGEVGGWLEEHSPVLHALHSSGVVSIACSVITF